MRWAILGFMLLLIIAVTGCDRFKNDGNKKERDTASEATEIEDTETETADTDSQDDDFSELSNLSPIQVEGRKLEEIAAALEAKRELLEQKERDIINREQMVTRLESEALSQKTELQALQNETQLALDNAKADIEKKYKKEHEKLLKHWEKIKQKHKEFIVKYLNYAESKNKDSLEPEIKRLRAERQQRIDQLLKTIEGMNPQSCAMMITSMEHDDAVEVLSGLNSAKTAEILSNMAPQKSAELARGLMGPKVPTIPELEDVEFPKAPSDKDTGGDKPGESK